MTLTEDITAAPMATVTVILTIILMGMNMSIIIIITIMIALASLKSKLPKESKFQVEILNPHVLKITTVMTTFIVIQLKKKR